MFTPATKFGSKLRAAIYGPSGSGKTFTSLRLATGIGGRIGLIDSERGRARKYADLFKFDVCEIEDRSIDSYLRVIDEAEKSGIDVLIIDSLSHAWAELLIEVDKAAGTRFRGNKWGAWSEGTPKQMNFIDRLLAYRGHVIATMRAATEWQTETADGGKTKPVRVGLKPRQGKDIEYEFDFLLEMSPEHFGTVIKDCSGKYQDQVIERPGEDFGRDLAAWLGEGAPPPEPITSRARTEDQRRAETRRGPASSTGTAPPMARY